MPRVKPALPPLLEAGGGSRCSAYRLSASTKGQKILINWASFSELAAFVLESVTIVMGPETIVVEPIAVVIEPATAVMRPLTVVIAPLTVVIGLMILNMWPFRLNNGSKSQYSAIQSQ